MDPLALADQAFTFKRARDCCIKTRYSRNFYGCNIKDNQKLNVYSSKSFVNNNQNLFCDSEGNNSKEFLYYIGGLQNYLPDAMLLFKPYANSYRRFVIDASPINTHWGIENRTVAFRVPTLQTRSRRMK